LQDDSIKSISYRSRSWLLLLSVAPLACIFLIRARWKIAVGFSEASLKQPDWGWPQLE